MDEHQERAMSNEEIYSADVDMESIKPISFSIKEKAPESHRYYGTKEIQCNNQFLKWLNRDVLILRNSLPQGIFVKTFEDRMDLFSIMIQGPEKTPYEGALFFFDVHLPNEYPQYPPNVYYHSFHEKYTSFLGSFRSQSLNPLLYTSGKVCLSILGTWAAGPQWDPKNSSLLQIFISIQALVLVEEPLLIGPGSFGSKGGELSRRYNLNLLELVYKSLINICDNPPPLFANEIRHHFETVGLEVTNKRKLWASQNDYKDTELEANINHELCFLPSFPINSPDEGFKLEFNNLITRFESKVHDLLSSNNKQTLEVHHIEEEEEVDQLTRDVPNDIRISMEDVSHATFEGFDFNTSGSSARKPITRRMKLAIVLYFLLSYIVLLIIERTFQKLFFKQYSRTIAILSGVIIRLIGLLGSYNIGMIVCENMILTCFLTMYVTIVPTIFLHI